MKKPIFILIGLVLLVASFVLGARVGTQAFLQADAQYKASLATYKLKALDANNLDNLRISLEFDIDDNFWLHSEGSKNPFLVLWPELTSNGIESLVNAATYRLQNPREYVSSETLNTMSAEEQNRLILRGKQIDALVKKYGK